MSELTSKQQQFLKKLAQEAVKAAASNGPAPDVTTLAEAAQVAIEGPLAEKRGAFVTLTIQNRLRGCIGYIEGFKPLIEAVADNGRSAAVGDPRFEPLKVHELPNVEIEISVLTPLKEVPSYQEIVVGRHGVLLEKNGRRSVFLPQVATEQGWDLHTTLTQLCLKAGLGPLEWQQGTKFEVFEAQIF